MLKRFKLGLGGLLVVAVAVVAMPASALALETNKNDTFNCTFSGSTTSLTPPVKLVGGGGSYGFSGTGSCDVSGDTSHAADNATGVAITISSTGTYTNQVCGTGTATGSATLSSSNGEFPATIAYSINFTAGHGTLTVTGGTHADGTGASATASGSGVVDIRPVYPPIPAPGDCTNGFTITGNANITATDD